MSFYIDSSKSYERFDKIIKPILEKEFFFTFDVVEGVRNLNSAFNLDVFGGIDAWVFDSIGVRGLSIRTQMGKKSYYSFTVRKERDNGKQKTEFEKRQYAIKNNYLYPNLSLHGYFDNNNNLFNFAMANTKDIFEMIDKGLFEEQLNDKFLDKTKFLSVYWQDMVENGYDLITYPFIDYKK